MPTQTLIQLVETHWTKRSRGAPGAVARNAVPQVVRFPAVTRSEAVLIHRASFSEHGQFAHPAAQDFAVFTQADSSRYHLEVTHQDDAAKVQFFGVPNLPTSGRPIDDVLLAPDTWLQIIANVRLSTDDSWIYRKFVFNIAHAPRSDANALVSSQPPVASLDHQISLW